MITVETYEAEPRLSALLALVEEKGEIILICRHGKPVAELRVVSTDNLQPDPLQLHPELAAKILYDPTEPASEDEWPSDCR